MEESGLRYYPGIPLEGLRKIAHTKIKDYQCPVLKQNSF
jgi:hypothetical protein